ncbi:MAG TPA: DUF262 domain-containing protein [Bacteroidales bacterium]|nr:DUF262 domain-containing protein [Bacteroidales bacterium]
MSELKTCFKKVDYELSGLLHYIEIGDIGLPDIQRPFVWENTKVRDLFDSMYRGFPVGYLLFWENVVANGVRQIGSGEKAHVIPNRLIVDGQQRLTSLYAVIKGKKVLDASYKYRYVEIAFRPRDGKFSVTDAAIRRDPEWINNISEIWASGKSSHKIVKEYIEKINQRTTLTDDEEELISNNLDRLFDIQKYPFTALEISSIVDEEEVADIFVRINSEGVTLNQADFILTLLSVFWDEGRKALEDFSRFSRIVPESGTPSPYNYFIKPYPDQLLRVAIALGFGRGKLKSVYQILRGKDPETGAYSTQKRDEQFEILQKAQDQVLNLTNWHQFMSCLIGAGFRGEEMISSQNALLYAYAFYLMGRTRFHIPEHILQKLIGRWFFASSLTARYSMAPESTMDSDLIHLKDLQSGDLFIQELEEMIAGALTNDFWNITLPMGLESSSSRSPIYFAYLSSQILLHAPVLFSHKIIADLMDPMLKTVKKPLEKHHLFPRAWLENNEKIKDIRMINQIANFALIEWPDNIDISDGDPRRYIPEIRGHVKDENAWKKMLELHALPEQWENMTYLEFLAKRRYLMAQIIRKGYECLL